MKTDRLYAITVYLLNHGRTSARQLASHFEVSLRTVQRDIDSLCLAGIPVISTAGAAGGYEISPRFSLDRHLASQDDYSYILTALKGFVSASNDKKAMATLEKISHLHKSPDSGIILDFSVLREGEQEALQALQTAIAKKLTVEFTYTNNNCETRTHSVEPIALLYRWYSWYLLAYSKVKKDYRTYKLVRMSDLKITGIPITADHAAPDIILKNADKTDFRKYTEVILKCREPAIARVQEYLKGTVTETLSGGEALMKLTVVENEQHWIGTLLSLGDSVQIISPESIRKRVLESAEKILSLYK